jgi:hypothetical protein
MSREKANASGITGSIGFCCNIKFRKGNEENLIQA